VTFSEPGYDIALAIELVRRDYLSNVQDGRHSSIVLDESTIASKTATVGVWNGCRAFIPKARAQLRGELPQPDVLLRRATGVSSRPTTSTRRVSHLPLAPRPRRRADRRLGLAPPARIVRCGNLEHIPKTRNFVGQRACSRSDKRASKLAAYGKSSTCKASCHLTNPTVGRIILNPP